MKDVHHEDTRVFWVPVNYLSFYSELYLTSKCAGGTMRTGSIAMIGFPSLPRLRGKAIPSATYMQASA
jgi:hypothetical protein